MNSFIRKKIISFLLSFFFIIFFSFVAMKALPGDPFSSENPMPEEVLHSLMNHYHLDLSLWKQFLYYLKGVLTFDLGPSLVHHGKHVTDIILDGLPYTFLLGIEALIIALGLGIPLGVYSAWKEDSSLDKASYLFSFIALSIPNFVMATLLQYFLGMKLHLFPVAKFSSFWHSILPAFSLSLFPSAQIFRFIKSSTRKVMQEGYIVTAFLQGLSERRILWKHVIPVAIVPLFGYLTPIVTYFFTGSFVIERIFSIPGLGNWMVESISARDYPLIMGMILFYSLILLLLGLVMDLITLLLVPSIRKDMAYA